MQEYYAQNNKINTESKENQENMSALSKIIMESGQPHPTFGLIQNPAS